MPEVLHLDIQLPPVLRLRLLKPPAVLPAEMANVIVGRPGPPGGSTYEHTQAAAAAVWTVAHNLARYPSVTVTDHFGEIIAADVKYLDENIVRVTHGAPVAGFAYLN